MRGRPSSSSSPSRSVMQQLQENSVMPTDDDYLRIMDAIRRTRKRRLWPTIICKRFLARTFPILT